MATPMSKAREPGKRIPTLSVESHAHVCLLRLGDEEEVCATRQRLPHRPLSHQSSAGSAVLSSVASSNRLRERRIVNRCCLTHLRSKVWKELAVSDDDKSVMRFRSQQATEHAKDLRIITTLTVCFGLFGILVKQAGIACATLDRWHVRRIDVFPSQPLPRHLCEPRM